LVRLISWSVACANAQTSHRYGVDQNRLDDHRGGIIRNNFIHRGAEQTGDAGIAVWNSPDTLIEHNTVVLSGTYANSIEYRFATTTGVTISNNLTDGLIRQRDGAGATLFGNVGGAQPSWFADFAAGDLHLAETATPAIDRAVGPFAANDYDHQPRPIGAAAEVGADEFSLEEPPPPPPSAPAIDSLSVSPSAVAQGETVTLAASGDVDGDLAGVNFYLDVNGSGTIEAGTDLLIGQDSSGEGGWSVIYVTTDLAAGSHQFLAIAKDAGGMTSSVVTATLRVSVPPPAFQKRFDFGTATSPVETGYIQATPATLSSAGLGYGWAKTSVGALDRGIDAPLKRDFNYTRDNRFLVSVPNGTYEVTLVMGDAAACTLSYADLLLLAGQFLHQQKCLPTG
jgi:hypothetical protein